MKIRVEDLENISKQPIELFYDGIKAQETREKYTRVLRRVLCEMLEDVLHGTFEERAAEFVNKSKGNPDLALSILLAISKKLRERTKLPETDDNYLNPNTIRNFFKPIKKLFEMNGVAVAWSRVEATFPELNNKSKGRGYERNEIESGLEYANGAIDRAIMLTAASSGIREGAFSLNWENLQPVYRVDNKLVFDITESQVEKAEIVCAILTIYFGTESEGPAFITPEAYYAIMNYRSTWIREVGREPKPTEPIFKQEGDFPIMLKPTAIKSRIERIFREAGLRTPLPKGKRRHEIPAMNGFRRFFDKISKGTVSRDSPLAALIKKEYMMGHTGLVKTDRNYYQAHIFELVEEYLEMVPHLTINSKERERMEKEKALQQNQELQDQKMIQKDVMRDLEEMKLAQQAHSVAAAEKERFLLEKIASLEEKINKKS